jgi:rhodanese-related sulfurtransferase
MHSNINHKQGFLIMTKKQFLNTLYWVAFIAIALYFAYSKGWILSNFDSITPTQAQELLKEGDNVVVLDVRTPDEFTQGHIQDAVLMPVQLLEQNLAELDESKNKKILVYCASGMRSVAASRILSENGFTAINLKGGIGQWKSDGFEVVQ